MATRYARRRASTAHLDALQPQQLDILRGKLRIGIHRDAEVTDSAEAHRPLVSQAYLLGPPSRLTPACRPITGSHSLPWSCRPHTKATMWATVLNAQRGASNAVLLTSLGGGAFGNDETWIDAAMRRALQMGVSSRPRCEARQLWRTIPGTAAAGGGF